MLKQVLTGFALVSLLCSVRGDDGFSESRPSYEGPVNLFPGIKENCAEVNAIFCGNWDWLADYQPPKTYRLEAGDPGKEKPEERSRGLVDASENSLEKRFPVARRRNPTARGYKRGPGFRSWGGKRDSNVVRQGVESKAKFGPWGGKRDGEYVEGESIGSEEGKRARFQNWGGKRGSIWKERRFYFGEPFKKDVPKRPQFQSWGGKRAPWFEKFKSSNPSLFRYLNNGGEKRKFSSWGGKRNDYSVDEAIRHVFQNGEGKGAEASSGESPGGEKQMSDDDASQPIKTPKSNWEGDKLLDFDGWSGKGEDESKR